MGLDAVEIIMGIEREFNISISDRVASNFVTMGDTHRVIVDTLVAKGRAWSPELAGDVWHRLVRIVTQQMQIKPEAVRPESRWIPDITEFG